MTPLQDLSAAEEDVRSGVTIGVAGSHVLASDLGDREKWEEVINNQLIEWGSNPDQLADDDLIPPSGEVIRLACEVARTMSADGVAAPTRVVPTGDGGIVFERWDGDQFVKIEIGDDCSIEWFAFQDARLVQRRRLL